MADLTFDSLTSLSTWMAQRKESTMTDQDQPTQDALSDLRIQNRQPKRIPFDPECLKLAKYFLPDFSEDFPLNVCEEDRKDLAAEFQQVMEDFVDMLERRQDRAAGYDPRNDPLDHDYSMNG
jgi:hypothetical protein